MCAAWTCIFVDQDTCAAATLSLTTACCGLQAFGDAVLDGVLLFAVSTYDTTAFCCRTGGANKDILISPLVYSDGRNGLPPSAAWLYFMQECQRLEDRKHKADPRLVPDTAAGYPFCCLDPHSSPRTPKRARTASSIRSTTTVRLYAQAPARYHTGAEPGTGYTG